MCSHRTTKPIVRPKGDKNSRERSRSQLTLLEIEDRYKTYMITNNTIKERLRASAPQVKDNEAFMADTIRQINLMPSPNSELQESLRRYTMLERLAMRMDAVRWLLVGGTGSVAVGYAVFSHLEAILTAISALMVL